MSEETEAVMGPGFFVERPGDKYGNVGYTAGGLRVVAGRAEPRQGGARLVADEGDDIARRWPSGVMLRHFMRTPGPARPLTFEEWAALVGYSEGGGAKP